MLEYPLNIKKGRSNQAIPSCPNNNPSVGSRRLKHVREVVETVVHRDVGGTHTVVPI